MFLYSVDGTVFKTEQIQVSIALYLQRLLLCSALIELFFSKIIFTQCVYLVFINKFAITNYTPYVLFESINLIIILLNLVIY